MTVPNRVIPDSNLSPTSQPWGREQQALAVANRDSLNQLIEQGESDYQQFNAAVNGAAEQTYRVRDSVYRLPGGWVYRAQFTNFALPQQTWTFMNNVRLPFPRNKARAIVYANATVSVVASSGVEVYISLSSGIGSSLLVGVPSIDYTASGGKYYRQGQYTHSGVYELSRRGGATTASVQLWASSAIPADPETTMTFSVYYLYGGGEVRA